MFGRTDTRRHRKGRVRHLAVGVDACVDKPLEYELSELVFQSCYCGVEGLGHLIHVCRHVRAEILSTHRNIQNRYLSIHLIEPPVGEITHIYESLTSIFVIVIKRLLLLQKLYPHFHPTRFFWEYFLCIILNLKLSGNRLHRVRMCMETILLVYHLNKSSVPDLAVQCSDVWCQVHVQQKVILQKTQDSVNTHVNNTRTYSPHVWPCKYQ